MKFSRRDFLKLTGATAAGLAACKPGQDNVEKLISQLVPPENIIPGIPVWYTSGCTECPAGCGLLLKVREGRIIKVEGNPDHPIAAGHHCMRAESALQGLYNPDRIRQPLLRKGGTLEPVSWEEALQVLQDRLPSDIRSLGVLSDSATGAFAGLLDQMRQEGAWVVIDEVFSTDPIRRASRRLFGYDETPTWDFEKADLILSFGADFLDTWVSPVSFTQTYARRRTEENRLHHIQVESRASLTGLKADQRFVVPPGTELFVAGQILKRVVDAKGITGPIAEFAKNFQGENRVVTGLTDQDIDRIVQALLKAHHPVVLGGDLAPREGDEALWYAALALTMLLSQNSPLYYQGPQAWDRVSPREEREAFYNALGERLKALLVVDRNPAFTHPGFADIRKNLDFLVVLFPYLDETGEMADLVLPIRHPFEDWGDAEPRPGVYTLIQPGMQPLPHFDTRSRGDLLLDVMRHYGLDVPQTFMETLQSRWKDLHTRYGKEDFETFWTEALQRGGLFVEVPAKPLRILPHTPPDVPEPMELTDWMLVAYPSLRYWDGKLANRPWLQEVPHPVVKTSWRNVLEMHPDDASSLNVKEGQVFRLKTPYGMAELPVRFNPRLPRKTVAVESGQGHTALGRYAQNRGANVFEIVGSTFTLPVNLEKTTRRVVLTHTDGAMTTEGREVVGVMDLKTWHEERGKTLPSFEEEFKEKHPQIAAFWASYNHDAFKERYKESPYHWGLVVDTERCTGCSACVVACMAENNIPWVGEKLMAKGREMFWIRVERYFAEHSHRVHFVPMMCQQCENAPCEPVCPVIATYHDPDGLNEQVYNRCVGTRYCANNCPYKARRFNWFTFEWPEPMNWQLNPDITVRERGVMEKCTFCYQRIRLAKDQAKDEGRLVKDGDVTPACVQACPAEALVFGNFRDPESKIVQLSRDVRRFRILEETNTQPSVVYLKELWEEGYDVSQNHG